MSEKKKRKVIYTKSKNGRRKITMERQRKNGFGKWKIVRNEPAKRRKLW